MSAEYFFKLSFVVLVILLVQSLPGWAALWSTVGAVLYICLLKLEVV
jgi:hypothetical protein